MLVTKKRSTRESEIIVSIDDEKRREFKIDTPLAFLNHMIETIAWRSCLNIDITFKTKTYSLDHVVAEDSGIVIGTALFEIIQNKLSKGINAQGAGIACIDEAMSISSLSVEGRSNSFIDLERKKTAMKRAEDTLG